MKITCGSCAAKYTVSDDKVQGKTVKVKCRKCGAVIVVSSTGEVQTTGGAAGVSAAAAAAPSYTVSVSDTDQRTLTLGQVVDAYNEGVIDAETYVWAEGMDDWQALKDVDAIVDALHAAASADGAAAGGEYDEQDDDLGATVAMSPGGDGAPAGFGASAPAQQHYRAAPAAVAAGSFPSASGSAAASPAGGYFQMSASAGSRGGGGAGFSGPSIGASSGPMAPTENSAIFSLNMLTAKVGGDAPSGSPSSTNEDSGLIDLKALAAGMGGDSGGVVAAAPYDGAGMFPLGAPLPPQAAPMALSIHPAQAPANRGMIIFLAGAVVVLGAALVFLVVRDTGPDPGGAATAATATQAPTATLPPTAEPSATVTATASASAGASASASSKVAARPYPGGKRPPTGGTGSPPGTGASPTAKPPSGGNCGCQPNDLMCNMRCSQKK